MEIPPHIADAVHDATSASAPADGPSIAKSDAFATPASLASFNKQLDRWVAQRATGIRLRITPPMAQVMLERNHSETWHNRPLHRSAVARYARFMRTGRWAYTAEPLIFSTEGELLNGQTRLTALIQAGVAVDMLLTFGIDREAFKYMDIGAKRTAADTFAVENIPNHTAASAATKLIYLYQTDEAWAGEQFGSNVQAENDVLLDYYHKLGDVQDCLKAGRLVLAEHSGLLTPGWANFLYYVCSHTDQARADSFFKRLLTGIGITSDRDMAGVARAKLMQLLRENARTGGASQTYRGAIVAIAWNAESARRPLRKLGWRTRDIRAPFPRVK